MSYLVPDFFLSVVFMVKSDVFGGNMVGGWTRCARGCAASLAMSVFISFAGPVSGGGWRQLSVAGGCPPLLLVKVVLPTEAPAIYDNASPELQADLP